MENAGVRPQAILDLPRYFFLGNGSFSVVIFLPWPWTPQVSAYPLTYIRPLKGSVVISVIVMVVSPHCTLTAKDIQTLRNTILANCRACVTQTYDLDKPLVLCRPRWVSQTANWLQEQSCRQSAADRVVSPPSSRRSRPCRRSRLRCGHIAPRTETIDRVNGIRDWFVIGQSEIRGIPASCQVPVAPRPSTARSCSKIPRMSSSVFLLRENMGNSMIAWPRQLYQLARDAGQWKRKGRNVQFGHSHTLWHWSCRYSSRYIDDI